MGGGSVGGGVVFRFHILCCGAGVGKEVQGSGKDGKCFRERGRVNGSLYPSFLLILNPNPFNISLIFLIPYLTN